ncbi:MAG: DUF2147 domain-containing protein [Gillisia sp.]
MKKSTILFLCLVFTGMNFYAQTVFGKWKTINDQTGKANSIVEIYEEEGSGELHGKLLKITKVEDRNSICSNCEGDLKNKPIEGMVIMQGLEKSGDQYVGGIVTDPKSGKEYKCKIWLDEDNPDLLNVRGYIAFFYRTQIWERVK